MLTVEGIVSFMIGAVIACLIFGLMFFAISYAAKEFPRFAPFVRFLRFALVILIVLFAIGFLLHISGHPIVRF